MLDESLERGWKGTLGSSKVFFIGGGNASLKNMLHWVCIYYSQLEVSTQPNCILERCSSME